MNRDMLLALVVACGLSLTIGWEVRQAETPVEEAPRPTPSDAVATAPSAEIGQPDQNWLATTLERPLFRADRRPPRPPASSPPAQPARLTGLMTGPFGRRAIFQIVDNPKPVVAEEGMRIGGLVVRSIDADRAVVETEGELRTMMPSFAQARPAEHR
jgi:hypothetical protein